MVMNTRIRTLLNEATSGIDPDLSLQRTVTLNEMEKFAELIIKECCETVANTEIEGNNNAVLRGEILMRLTKRFGVKE
jgi:hypothetical protein